MSRAPMHHVIHWLAVSHASRGFRRRRAWRTAILRKAQLAEATIEPHNHVEAGGDYVQECGGSRGSSGNEMTRSGRRRPRDGRYGTPHAADYCRC